MGVNALNLVFAIVALVGFPWVKLRISTSSFGTAFVTVKLFQIDGLPCRVSGTWYPTECDFVTLAKVSAGVALALVLLALLFSVRVIRGSRDGKLSTLHIASAHILACVFAALPSAITLTWNLYSVEVSYGVYAMGVVAVLEIFLAIYSCVAVQKALVLDSPPLPEQEPVHVKTELVETGDANQNYYRAQPPVPQVPAPQVPVPQSSAVRIPVAQATRAESPEVKASEAQAPSVAVQIL